MRSFCSKATKVPFMRFGCNSIKKFNFFQLNNNLKTISLCNNSFYRFSSNFFFLSKLLQEITFNVPKMGDSITEGTIFEMKKKIGEYVELDEVIAIIETDKVKVDIRAENAGVITSLFADEGATVEVGKPFFEVDTSAPKPAAAAKKEEKPAEMAKSETTSAPQEQPKAEAKKEAPKEKKPEPVTFTPPKVSQTGTRNEKREKMSRMRLRIAERMKEAQNTYALLTTFQEVLNNYSNSIG